MNPTIPAAGVLLAFLALPALAADPAKDEAMLKLGRDGWLGLGWPKEFGGQGR